MNSSRPTLQRSTLLLSNEFSSLTHTHTNIHAHEHTRARTNSRAYTHTHAHTRHAYNILYTARQSIERRALADITSPAPAKLIYATCLKYIFHHSHMRARSLHSVALLPLSSAPFRSLQLAAWARASAELLNAMQFELNRNLRLSCACTVGDAVLCIGASKLHCL